MSLRTRTGGDKGVMAAWRRSRRSPWRRASDALAGIGLRRVLSETPIAKRTEDQPPDPDQPDPGHRRRRRSSSGIMTPEEAIVIAEGKGLDLVEIAPTAVPPVCRIVDYGKFLYDEKKKAAEAKKKQKQIVVKEIKLRPKIEEHDFQVKKRHIEEFLARATRSRSRCASGVARSFTPRWPRSSSSASPRRWSKRARSSGRPPWKPGPWSCCSRPSRSDPRNRRRQSMPKMKTHRASAKRFKVTATGKFKRGKAYHRHILTSKDRKRKNRLQDGRPGPRGRPRQGQAAPALRLKTGARPRAPLTGARRRAPEEMRCPEYAAAITKWSAAKS